MVEEQVRPTVEAYGPLREAADSFTLLQGFKVDQLKRCASLLLISKKGRKEVIHQNCVQRLLECRRMNDSLADDVVLCVHVEGRPTKPDFRAEFGGCSAIAQKLEGSVPNNGVLDPSTSMSMFRCVCGGGKGRLGLVTCSDCKKQSHSSCYSLRASYPGFVCELCRTKYSDPFWRAVGNLPVLPTLMKSNRSDRLRNYNGVNTVSAEKAFVMNREDIREIRKKVKSFTISCHLLLDSVLYRQHWPPASIVTVNGRRFRPTERAYNQKLGNRSCDKRLDVSEALCEGTNRVSLVGQDQRMYLVVFEIAQRLDVRQVVEKIKEIFFSKGTDVEKMTRRAEERARRICSGNGEDDVVALSLRVSLRCPLGGVIVSNPARFASCRHLACFDLESFLYICSQTGKLQCPICMKIEPYSSLRIDWYLHTVLKQLQSCGIEEVSEIEIDPSGLWKVPEGRYHQQKWHSICSSSPPEFVEGGVLDVDIKQEVDNTNMTNDMEPSELEELRQAAEACARDAGGTITSNTFSARVSQAGTSAVGDPVVLVESDGEQEAVPRGETAMDRAAAVALMASMRGHYNEEDCQSFMGLISRSLPSDSQLEDEMLALLTNRPVRMRGPLDSFVTQGRDKRLCTSGTSEGQREATLNGIPLIEID